jgi:tripartite-type tricarboxylate transporter receptor subunit TctC
VPHPFRLLGVLAFACLAAVQNAEAQPYPAATIRIIVGYAAGGATDAMARQLATALSEKLQAVVIVDNKPGANTIIASRAVATAAADGYTLFLADPSSIVLNPFLFKKLGYGPASFAPIGQVTSNPLGLLVPAGSPIRTLPEFTAAARSGAVTYGSPGLGNLNHIAMEMFQKQAQVHLTHVPYKGAAPAIQDLISGQIAALFIDIPSAMPFIQAGKVRVLAVSAASRLKNLPDVPTFAESGLPGFEVKSWFGLLAPAKTPTETVKTLGAALNEVVQAPRFQAWLQTMSFQQQTGTPEAFGRLLAAETESYGPLIRELNLSLD